MSKWPVKAECQARPRKLPAWGLDGEVRGPHKGSDISWPDGAALGLHTLNEAPMLRAPHAPVEIHASERLAKVRSRLKRWSGVRPPLWSPTCGCPGLQAECPAARTTPSFPSSAPQLSWPVSILPAGPTAHSLQIFLPAGHCSPRALGLQCPSVSFMWPDCCSIHFPGIGCSNQPSLLPQHQVGQLPGSDNLSYFPTRSSGLQKGWF